MRSILIGKSSGLPVFPNVVEPFMASGSLRQRAQATADGLTTARPVELSFRNIQSQLKNLPTPVATRTQQESGVSRVSKRKRTLARPYKSMKI